MINMIGDFDFLDLEGVPIPPQEEVRLVTRPGVDGVGFSRIGLRSPEFTLVSKVDAYSFYHATVLLNQYAAYVGQTASLIQNDVDYFVEGFVVAVLGVTPRACEGIAGLVGGLNYPSLGWLEAIWRLRAISLALAD